MVSLALFLAAFGPLSTRYGFPSGNSSTAPIDATATVTPVSCENALFPPPHRAGLWTSGLWILSTPNAEEAQSPFSLGFVDAQCGHGASHGPACTQCSSGMKGTSSRAGLVDSYVRECLRHVSRMQSGSSCDPAAPDKHTKTTGQTSPTLMLLPLLRTLLMPLCCVHFTPAAA